MSFRDRLPPAEKENEEVASTMRNLLTRKQLIRLLLPCGDENEINVAWLPTSCKYSR